MSRLPVLTAVSDPAWEAAFLGAAQTRELGILVVRRCLDLADLLAAASTGTARAALLDVRLRRLDAESLARLVHMGVAPVLRVPDGDPQALERARRLGAFATVTDTAAPQAVAAALREAASSRVAAGTSFAWAVPQEPIARPAAPPEAAGTDAPDGGSVRAGIVLSVWGPTGAPGRSTVALNVAAELAGLGVAALLADADVYGGTLAQQLGLLDEAPGLAAAARQAGLGQLDAPTLAGLARQVRPGLRILSGIARAARWPELRPGAVDRVLEASRELAAVTVVDCGFSLERDDELSYDTAAPRRNGATLAALAAADVVIAVGAADPVGLQRLVRGLDELRDLVPRPRVAVNKVRHSVGAGRHGEAVRAALARHARVDEPWLLPWDPAACDAALMSGRALCEAAPRSDLRGALNALAADLAGVSARRRRGFVGRRRGRESPGERTRQSRPEAHAGR